MHSTPTSASVASSGGHYSSPYYRPGHSQQEHDIGTGTVHDPHVIYVDPNRPEAHPGITCRTITNHEHNNHHYTVQDVEVQVVEPDLDHHSLTFVPPRSAILKRPALDFYQRSSTAVIGEFADLSAAQIEARKKHAAAVCDPKDDRFYSYTKIIWPPRITLDQSILSNGNQELLLTPVDSAVIRFDPANEQEDADLLREQDIKVTIDAVTTSSYLIWLIAEKNPGEKLAPVASPAPRSHRKARKKVTI